MRTDSTIGENVARSRTILPAAGFCLTELRSASGLALQTLPSGVIHAIRHGSVLINQFMPGPAEDGMFRLLLRWHDGDRIEGWIPVAGVGHSFACDGGAATWRSNCVNAGLEATTGLRLDPRIAAWTWRVRVRNVGDKARRIDVVLGQDLGLGDAGAVRNNEAYNSQYLDLAPVEDAEFGHVLCARQNLALSGGRHPWLALACVGGAVAYCTDGSQFFGADHRLTGEPAAARLPRLPSKRLQYEFAYAGLQSRIVVVEPGASAEFVFVARFVESHPEATSAADLGLLHGLAAGSPVEFVPESLAATVAPSVFTSTRWLHGDRPGEDDWAAWFPGERRHEERDSSGALQSFFHGESAHVVSRDKEAVVARPHGHILRSGEWLWIDNGQFGVTCYASGVFGAQAYLGNPSLARLLSVVRNHLNVVRAGGQRIFVCRWDRWYQLGVPSAFAIEPERVRWIYRFGGAVVEAVVWCSAARPCANLQLSVVAGGPMEFLFTHQLALGANEYDTGGRIESAADEAWVGVHPATESLVARQQPGVCFAIAAADPEATAAISGDELIYSDGIPRCSGFVTIRTKPVDKFGVILLGTADGGDALSGAVAAARAEFSSEAAPSRPPAAPLRLRGGKDAGVGSIDEVLPWFTHNAAIHFSAPHGLEQYGGAAWGVRDVCQGPLEWLLAAGELSAARRALLAVFGQQYAGDGSWPQWFMFPPYAHIQQAHCHGDVCFWPVKALCDYVEASGDFKLLGEVVGYTDPVKFMPGGPREPLWAHCDRVVDQCEARFVAGTALVNYGDGDWDDTLQPADPAMRERLVSAWTVALVYHSFGRLAEVSRRAGEEKRARKIEALLARIRADFAAKMMPGGVVAGFLVAEDGGRFRPLLHPEDRVTGIRYRLLPLTRAILAGLFTKEEAARHLDLIESELRFADGVRLMSDPVPYAGGREKLFKRAESAANVGREIGLQYVHAHIRYAEAMARVGDADKLWWALQVVNPVAIQRVVPNAAIRQSNVYFSSSDADFDDRYEAADGWGRLRRSEVAVRGGWRLYSSGPGLFLHKVRACLLGIRESFDDVVFDPVLPRSLDGLVATTFLCGRQVELHFRVREGVFAPRSISINGSPVPVDRREPNPYRRGGSRVSRDAIAAALRESGNVIDVEL